MILRKVDLGALIGTDIAELAMRIVAALLILVVGLWLVKLLVNLAKKTVFYKKQTTELQSFFASALKALGYALVIIMAVTTVGVPTASILAVLGSCGLAIGLALQGSPTWRVASCSWCSGPSRWATSSAMAPMMAR